MAIPADELPDLAQLAGLYDATSLGGARGSLLDHAGNALDVPKDALTEHTYIVDGCNFQFTATLLSGREGYATHVREAHAAALGRVEYSTMVKRPSNDVKCASKRINDKGKALAQHLGSVHYDYERATCRFCGKDKTLSRMDAVRRHWVACKRRWLLLKRLIPSANGMVAMEDAAYEDLVKRFTE